MSLRHDLSMDPQLCGGTTSVHELLAPCFRSGAGDKPQYWAGGRGRGEGVLPFMGVICFSYNVIPKYFKSPGLSDL